MIAGTLLPEHLHENIAAIANGPLSEDVYLEAKRRLEAQGVKPAE
jgi:hypothetical protein